MKRSAAWLISRGMLPLALLVLPAASPRQAESWTLDNLDRIGGRPVTVESTPQVICWTGGKAIAFDGVDDRLVVKGRPLVGVTRFTIEALIRPEGGVTEQRFLHLAETNPQTGADVTHTETTHDTNNRIMFELRSSPAGFFIDGYLKSRAGDVALAVPAKIHPNGAWYVLSQTYDGAVYRTYVDGVLQGEVTTPFLPQGPGNVGIGSRLNKESYFKGAIARLRFSERALSPREFMKAPRKATDKACPR
ncbi:hypothetical protein HNO88_002013 [Novosphingobium chloroacetimidivorans]|uniref:LamG domain-containing protein n=1 Tax=Novosphingobium chloroacetimidivorans TaxID=1428314 RepID=A0A7W7K9G1_9SPHN|nr:LamG domain-containing protein [Novosphingobium chloroacetimidivorans]MBB4858687.1 hypothetical protein [Novosphingobium chloroacetimidivorans]